MTFSQFLSILRARWLAMLLVVVLLVAGTTAVSLVLPRQYTATASVVVDFKPDPVSAVVFGGMASPPSSQPRSTSSAANAWRCASCATSS